VHLDLVPFLAVSTLLIILPGPDTAVVTKNALLAGRRRGIAAAVGVSIGLVIWTAAAALGIATLLRASDVAFNALKLAGAAYLIWIGVQLLRSRGRTDAPMDPADAPRHSRRALREGLLSDLGNPKIAVFFTSFLPQFVGGHGAAFGPLLVLGCIFAALTLAWLAAYSIAVGRASALVRRTRVRRALDRVTGIALVAFGVRLAFERR
jgi:RhtB (resistance to homoserine/threonine) family protein